MNSKTFNLVNSVLGLMVFAFLATRACDSDIEAFRYDRFKDCMKMTGDKELCKELLK